MTDSDDFIEVSVQEGYAHWAAQYDQEDNPLISLEEQIALPLLVGLRPDFALDLGTGTGRYAVHLAGQGIPVIGLDQSAAMLTVARRVSAKFQDRPLFCKQSLEDALPCRSDSFDLIVAALVLCHVMDLQAVAAEAYRVLRPGGHILVTDFHPAVVAAGWRTQFRNQDGIYLLPTAHHRWEDYIRALQDAGFRIKSFTEGLVREAPSKTFRENILEKDGDKPFCLVILASKPVT